MNALLPAALLCLSTGLMLGFHRPRARRWALVMASVMLIAAGWIGARHGRDALLGATWAVILAAAGTALLSWRTPAALALAIAAGGLAGLLVTGWPRVALIATISLTALLARWAVARGASVVVKVVAAWMLATAALNATLMTLPITPGYLPDHLE